MFYIISLHTFYIYHVIITLETDCIFFKRSTFVGSAWSFGFFIPPQRPMTSDFEGFLYQILFSYYFLIFILKKEPVFPFSMLRAEQGHYFFYNVFGMTRSLTGD